MPNDTLNDLDPVIQAELEGKRTRLKATLSSAVSVDPEAVAQQSRLAAFLDQPRGVVAAMPEEAKRTAAIKTVTDNAAASSVLQRKYSDADFAALAHDDSGALSTIAAAAKYFVSAPGASSTLGGDITAAYHGAQSGAAGALGAIARTASVPLNFLDDTALPGGNPLRRLSEGFMAIADSQAAAGKVSAGKSETWLGGAVSSGVQSLAQNLPFMMLGLLPGGQGAALTGMGAMSGGQSYQKDIAAGVSHPLALIHGASDAVIEAGTEMGPLGGLVHELKAGSGLLTTILKNAWAENKGEQVATALQDLNDWAVNDRNNGKTFVDYLKARPEAAAQTLIATLIGAGGNVSIMQGVQGAVDRAAGFERGAQQAEHNAQVMEAMQTTAQASKLLERSPETLAAYMQDLAEQGAPAVYVDTAKLVEAGVDMQALARTVPSVATQLAQADTGGDLVIPTGELLTATLGTEFAQPLIDNARTSADSMSRAEAKVYMQEQGATVQAQIEQALAERDGDAQFKASRDQVQSQILKELNEVKRFTAKVNEQYATLTANFYAVMAARLGVTPQQFADTYRLGFAAQAGTGARVLEQAGTLDQLQQTLAAAGLDTSISESKGVITLSKIVVPEAERGGGLGTQAMEALVRYADATGQHLALTPSADFGGDKKRLTAFYKRFGFVENKGKNRAFSTRESMYRQAPGKVLEQSARGQIAFGDDITAQKSIVSLYKGADLSTFVHESGHFYLEVQADLAARLAGRAAAGQTLTPGEQGIVGDMDTTLAWMGVKATPDQSALLVWQTMTPEEKRQYHEQFARGFEAYAFEGKAPSMELTKVFQTFRAWLVNVYRSLLKSASATRTDVAGALDVQLTDEVRSVMDRMLATSNQIMEAEAARDMGPLFKTAEQAGMTLDEFRAYHDQGTQATADAIDALQGRGLRDMQWLQNARSRKLKELQKQHDSLRAGITAEVRREVMAQPIYQAWAFLTSKSDERVVPGVTALDTADLSQGAGKLRTQVLREMYGIEDDAVWRKLSALHMTSDTVGSHPDLVAELFGFGSGDELVQKIAQAEPPAEVIRGMTDQRMLEEHGDLASPAGIERAADEAIHNDARARFVATELATLQKAMSVREKVPGQRNTVDVLARAAREYASATIAKLKVRDIRPGQYTAAEVRASKAAAKALGDVEKATMHKRNQLINMYAAKAAYAAQDEVIKAVEYFRKFDSNAVRSKLPADYVSQIDMLLSKFDLRAQSGAAVDRTKSLRTWVQSRLNAGEIPNISEQLLTGEERKAYNAAINSRDDEGNLVYPDDDERIKLLADAIERSALRSVKDMTLEELRGLRDTVQQIEHLGELKDKMLTNQAGASYSATRDLLAATVEANAKDKGKNTRTDNTWLGGKVDGLKQFGASHIKPAIWMRIFDGGKDNGPWWATLVRPANERATFETSRGAKATSELMGILGPVLKDVSHLDKIGKGRFFPTLNTSLNWEERMAFAFNYGNESNLQRLMGGGIAGVTKALSMSQVQTVLNTLSAAEWRAVQGVWDHFESYRPEIGAKELRVNGVEPAWIDARPFSVKTSDGQTIDLRGGYYPVKFDAKTSLKAQQHSDAQAAKDAMKAAYSAATTQRSFTKERVEEVTGRPLLLNLQGLYSGINDVIHDLAWHEWVIDVNRLLRSDSVDAAIREHYGANVKKELTKWRDDIVAGSARLDHGIENAAGWARKFVSSAALTYNVVSALMQPLGITQSFSRVGTKWVGKGLGQYVGSPVETTKMVQEKSEYMTNRTRTMFRDVNELRNRVQGQTTGRELMGRYGYFMTMHMQMMVDVPTWVGAYEKGLAEGHADDVAIALADQSVKDSQGGGEEVDQSGIVRGGPMIKLFTAFYDFMNTQANVLYLKNATAENKADKFMHMAMVGLVTPMLAAALRDALIAGDSGDWDDWEKIVKKLLGEGLNNLIGMMAFGREFAQVAKALYGEDKGIGYSGPTGLRVIPDAYKLAQQAHQGDMDDAFRKAMLNVAGDLSGIPSVQINRTINGAQALAEGKTSNPGALLTGFQEPH